MAEELATAGDRMKAVRRLADACLGVRYDKVAHGRAITNLTSESQVDPEIKTLLLRMAADRLAGGPDSGGYRLGIEKAIAYSASGSTPSRSTR